MECNPKMRLLPTMAMLSWAVVRVASSRSDISQRPAAITAVYLVFTVDCLLVRQVRACYR